MEFLQDKIAKSTITNDTVEFFLNEINEKTNNVLNDLKANHFEYVLEALLARCKKPEEFRVFGERCAALVEKLDHDELDRRYKQHYKLLSKLEGVAIGRGKEKEETKSTEESTSVRIADVDFCIDNTTLHSEFDLERFSSRIDELFQWFVPESLKSYKYFVAPYFPLIQSSGTGKTLLLHQYRKRQNLTNNAIQCELFLCLDVKKELKVHKQFNVNNYNVPQRDEVWKYLDRLLNGKGKKQANKFVLLFDEAQTLLKNDARYFRYLRGWLRQKRFRQQTDCCSIHRNNKYACQLLSRPTEGAGWS